MVINGDPLRSKCSWGMGVGMAWLTFGERPSVLSLSPVGVLWSRGSWGFGVLGYRLRDLGFWNNGSFRNLRLHFVVCQD